MCAFCAQSRERGTVIDRMTILGGSSVYVPEFIVSLTSHNVNCKEIVLYGRPGEKLRIVSEFCQRLVDRSGFPTRIIASTNLAESVDGAAYVLNHIRVGGMEARVRDEKLPPKFGMVGDESLGAGGVANALRTLPVVLDLAEQVAAVNPDCQFINLTNPMGTVVEALLKHTKLNVVGVCDLPGEYIRKVEHALGRGANGYYFDFFGVNHMGWIQDVRKGDSSVLGDVLDRIERAEDNGFDHDLIRLYRMVPTSTVALFFHTDKILAQQKKTSEFRGETLLRVESRLLKQYRNKKLAEVPPMPEKRNTPWYEQNITPLICAMEGTESRTMVLCVRNSGAIRDLPDLCSVEIPVDVAGHTLAPRKVGSCPRFLRGILHGIKESDRCVIEAVRHRSYEYALRALVANPLVPSVDSAKKFLDRVNKEEFLELH